jgi:CARDB
MFRSFRTRLAVGAAAVAVAAASLASVPTAPAYAVWFQPDIRVQANFSNDTSTKTTFGFRVENIGAADSGAVTLKGVCHGHNWGPTTVLSKTLSGLRSGQATTVYLTCKGGTASWVEATLTATTAGDLDTSNNSDEIDND